MSGRVILQPKFGRRVRHADGRIFSERGDPVVLDPFYRRLIADGDLVATTTARRSKKGTSR